MLKTSVISAWIEALLRGSKRVSWRTAAPAFIYLLRVCCIQSPLQLGESLRSVLMPVMFSSSPRDQSSTRPCLTLRPNTKPHTGASGMNSMLPQRSAVTTLGYGSGKATSSKSPDTCKEYDIPSLCNVLVVRGLKERYNEGEEDWETLKENVAKMKSFWKNESRVDQRKCRRTLQFF